jgi:hypothetical protein
MEPNNEEIKIPTLKAGSIMNVNIASDVYQRLIILLQDLVEGKTEEEMLEAKKQIDEKFVKDRWILNYETIFYIITICEKYAKANNMVEEMSIEEYQEMLSKSMPQ